MYNVIYIYILSYFIFNIYTMYFSILPSIYIYRFIS